MGYSCTAAASDTLQRLQDILSPRSAGKPINEFTGTDKRTYFWEIGEEQVDGKIIGKVFDVIGCRCAGYFEIAGSGRIIGFAYAPADACRRAERLN